MQRLFLTGWIRGVIDDEMDESSSSAKIAALGAELSQKLQLEVKMFLFEGGASLVVEGLKGGEVVHVANALACQVNRLYGRSAFFHTCSFEVSPLEQDIPHCIRIAKKNIDNHSECGGGFFIDGRLMSIKN